MIKPVLPQLFNKLFFLIIIQTYALFSILLYTPKQIYQINRIYMKKVVTIQYCKNCQNHKWNTRHNQARYANCYTQLKNILEKSGIQVKSSSEYRLGAFEIFVENYELFSKSKTQVFPDVQAVSRFIIQFFEQIKQKNQKYSHLLQKIDNSSKINFKKRITLSPGFARVSKFSSPNKSAKVYIQMFNAEKQLKNSRVNSRIISSYYSKANTSFSQNKSQNKLMVNSVLLNASDVNPEKNTAS